MLQFDTAAYIVVWLQRETHKMVASIVDAMYPDEAIKKVMRYHLAIDPETAPTGTVFVGRASADRNGAGRMLTPWMAREITTIETQPIFVYDDMAEGLDDIEQSETLAALDNLAYECDFYSDEYNFDPAEENWLQQQYRDEEAERKYGEYLNDSYDDWDDIDDDWGDEWGWDSTPPTNKGCYDIKTDDFEPEEVAYNDWIWDPTNQRYIKVEDYKVGGTD